MSEIARNYGWNKQSLWNQNTQMTMTTPIPMKQSPLKHFY